jgi:hypothetical protein
VNAATQFNALFDVQDDEVTDEQEFDISKLDALEND